MTEQRPDPTNPPDPSTSSDPMPPEPIASADEALAEPSLEAPTEPWEGSPDALGAQGLYADSGTDEMSGPAFGTTHGRGGGSSDRRTPGAPAGGAPPALIVGSVVGLAVIVAVAVWFLLLRPSDTGPAIGSPSPSPTATLTPEPTFTLEPTAEPTDEAPTLGPTPFQAPRFTDLRLADAESLAGERGLRLEIRFEETNDVDPDTVLSQDPPPGSQLFPGDTVTLVVAQPTPTVGVPDLRGMTETDAIAALLEVDLEPGERSDVIDAELDAGLIVRTDPRAGIEVRRGTIVDYIVSLGPPPTPSPSPTAAPIAVPAFVGLLRSDAEALADASGLLLDISEQPTLDAPPDTVLSQDPAEGTEVPAGSRVALRVAVLPPTVRVPDLVGQPEEDAVNALLEADLTAGDRSEAFDPDLAAGLVLASEPVAGSEVDRGSAVAYVVSAGPPPVRVPAFIGLSRADARSLADELGLLLDISEQPTLDAPPDTVLSQDPAEGTEVPAGSRVALRVAVLPPTVRVPDLVGQPEEDAVNALLEADLTAGDRSEAFDPDLAAGLVLASEPVAGSEVDRGSAVAYVVSAGPPPVRVPAFIGLSRADARSLADELGLLLDISEQPTLDAPPDTVLSQDPAEGTEVPAGSRVALRVAVLPPTVRVPDLVGQPEEDAVNALLEADLTAGDRSEAFDPDLAAGLVLASEPVAGSEVDRGSAVAYVVSAGPPPVRVPAFIGLSRADARSLADELGLLLDISEQPTLDAPPDTVLSQDPAEGTEVPAGSRVALRVAVLPPTVRVPDLVGQPEEDAVNALLEADLTAGDRSEAFDPDLAAGLVLASEPVAGSEVDRGSAVAYVVSAGPPPVRVPAFIGLSRADARSLADELGLLLDISEQPTLDAPPDTVLSQDPAEGTEVPAGSRVALRVAVLPPTVRVPDLVGQPEEDAVNALLEADLTAGDRSEAFDPDLAAGLVLASEPVAGSEVDRGSAVAYVVSAGPPPVRVPAFIGLSRADARSLADELGLLLDISEQPTLDAPPDTVLSQDPAEGTEVPAGSRVALRVAVLPPTVRVPDLVGQPEEDAVNALLEADLTAGDRSEAFDPDLAAGLVLASEPVAGSEVDRGSAVAYVVSAGPPPVRVPAFIGLSRADARSLADELGLLLDISEQPTLDAPPDTVLSQDPAEGTEVPAGSRVALRVAVLPPTVRVPDLVGQPEEDAVNALLEADLTAGDRSEAFDPDLAAGLVLASEPVAGSEVDRGSAVAYVVSAGPPPVRVPAFIGLSRADARSLADELGLLLDISEQPTLDAPPDTVLSQDPAEGTEVPAGSRVALRVAVLPPTVRVPDLVGQPEEDAVNALLEADLTAGDRSEAFDPDLAAGLVLASEPVAGSEVDRGSAVAYVVSAGPPPVRVPAFIGLSRADARSLADELGLLLDISEQPTLDAPPDTVLSQDPAEGTEVPAGSRVALRVAVLPPTVRVPDLVGQPEEDAVNALLEADLTAGDRSEAFDPDLAAGLVLASEPVAGSEVDRGSAVAYVVSAGPPPVRVPAFIGLSRADARSLADELGLLLDISEQPTLDAPPDTVLSQDPAEGTEVPAGSRVALRVAVLPPTVRVPDLVGQPEEDAVNALLEADLTAGDRSEAFDPDLAAGLVLASEPVAGSEVDRGSAVAYVVSAGPPPVRVPAFIGLSRADARSLADELGLLLDISEQPTLDAPPDTVLSQDPAEGTEVPAGSRVALRVAVLPPTVRVPDLVGQPEEDAVNALLEADLTAGDRSEAFDPDLAAGLVLASEPVAGSEVDRGSAVAYVVSAGPEALTVPVPSLRGLTEAEAVAALLEADLEPGERTQRFHETAAEGLVVRSDPRAGTEVDPGTRVDYVLSRGPEPIAAPDLVGLDVDAARAEADAAGLLLDVTRRTTSDAPAGTVLSQDPVAGADVQLGDTISIEVARESTTVVVPSLRALPEDDAVNAILEADLQPGSRSERFHDTIPAGAVMGSDPRAGTEVDRDSVVDYVVSLGPEGAEETPTPEPIDSALPSVPPDVIAQIDEVVSQVPPIRGIEPTGDVPYREITLRQFRRELRQKFDAENPPELVAAEEAYLKRLGLLPPDAVLRDLVIQLYQSQVAAYYDTDTGTMTLVKRDDDFGPADRMVVAHEYDHALQDQRWDLDAVTVRDATQGDRALARLALIEGDATALMTDWALANLTVDELGALGGSLAPTDQALLDSMPPLLRRQLEFPYFEGLVFVRQLRGLGDWEAVNAAWDQLPASTEQILHPEKYPSERPLKVALPDVAAALGLDWVAATEETMGELQIGVWVADGQSGEPAIIGLPAPLPNAESAAGWGGDRLVSLDGPDGSWAVVWQTAWDSDADADEFTATAEATMADLAGAHAVLRGADIVGGLPSPVLVVVASDDKALQLVRDTFGTG